MTPEAILMPRRYPHLQTETAWLTRPSGEARMKVRDVVRLLESDGWILVRVRGSHRQFKHISKPGVVTVAGKLNLDLPPGTLKSILRQAGLAEDS